MPRNNNVTLFGELTLLRLFVEAQSDGRRNISAWLSVRTDLPQLGGMHRVAAFSQLALEALAFCVMARAYRQPLNAHIGGWLYSTGDGHCYVVASELNFYVTEVQREQAVGVLKQLGAPPWSRSVRVNGWRVDISKCFVGAVDERLFA